MQAGKRERGGGGGLHVDGTHLSDLGVAILQRVRGGHCIVHAWRYRPYPGEFTRVRVRMCVSGDTCVRVFVRRQVLVCDVWYVGVSVWVWVWGDLPRLYMLC